MREYARTSTYQRAIHVNSNDFWDMVSASFFFSNFLSSTHGSHLALNLPSIDDSLTLHIHFNASCLYILIFMPTAK
uniref:Ovule protein n=1 Tax=Ascaris lumbricoides TaxID=6252 RepID=A0A0M3HL98_ASCLU